MASSLLAASDQVTWNNHRYQVFDLCGCTSWEQVKNLAAQTEQDVCDAAPHVVTITSEEENAFVRQLVDTADYSYDMALIGLEQEQVFETPINDICDSSTLVSGTGGLFHGTTHDATLDNAPTCKNETNVAPGVWYKITSTSANSTITASTCNPGTDFDTMINVYNGGCSNNLACVGASDDAYTNLPHDLCDVSSSVTWTAANAGEEYYVLIHGYSEYDIGDFVLTIKQKVAIEQATEPTNDACANAIAITTGIGSVHGTTHGATIDTVTCDSETNTMSAPGVWYTLTADSANSLITVDTCSAMTEFDTQISVYRGNSCAGLVCVDENDDYVDSEYDICDGTSRLSWTATNADEQYYILVHGYGEQDYGDFALNIRQQSSVVPSNDLCENAIPISGSTSVSGTTHSASVDSAACGYAYVEGPGVWYDVYAGSDSMITVSTGTCNGNTNLISQLSVFGGNCDSLTCLDGDDGIDECGYQSAVTFSAIGNTHYYVLVHGRNTNNHTGDFELNILEEYGPTETFYWITTESLSYTNWDASTLSGEVCAAMQVASGEWDDIACFGTDELQEDYAVVVEWECTPNYFDFAVTVDSIEISLTSTTNFSEAIIFQYSYTGPKPSAVPEVSFNYDIFQVDCNVPFATAGNTSQALYFTGFNESTIGKVIARLGIDLDAIESASAVWKHPNDDERQATLEFCGRWNIYVDNVLFQFHESAVNATINLKEDGGFEVSGINAGLDRIDANQLDESVAIEFPVSVTFCNDTSDPDATQSIVSQGTPIQLCIQLATPTTGVYVQTIDFLNYTATHATGDPVTLINGGTLQFSATTEVDCGQKAGVCRIKWLADANMFVNVDGNELDVIGWAVVSFGMDTRRRRVASAECSGVGTRMLDYGKQDGYQLTPFNFAVTNLQPTNHKESRGSFHAATLISVLVAGIAVIALAAFAAYCLRGKATATEPMVKKPQEMDPNAVTGTAQEDFAHLSSQSTEMALHTESQSEASDNTYEVVEM